LLWNASFAASRVTSVDSLAVERRGRHVVVLQPERDRPAITAAGIDDDRASVAPVAHEARRHR